MEIIYKLNSSVAKIDSIKLLFRNIIILIGIFAFTYISSTGDIDYVGSDIVNPYRYYIAVYNNASFFDFIETKFLLWDKIALS